MENERTLVMGAELLCTKALNSAEVSLLMASTDNIKNAMIHGRPAANRKNRKEHKDIIPFSGCTKSRGEATCTKTLKTAPLWENLTLPYDEIKVPLINLLPVYKATGIDNKIDIAQFLVNYDEAKKDNRKKRDEENNKRYRFSDEELRRNAILKTYTDTGSNESEYASISTNSILLCLGNGGIIHPKTCGQNPIHRKW